MSLGGYRDPAETAVEFYLDDMKETKQVRKLMAEARKLRRLAGDEYQEFWERCMLAQYFAGNDVAFVHVNGRFGIVGHGTPAEVDEQLSFLHPIDQQAKRICRVEPLEMIRAELRGGNVGTHITTVEVLPTRKWPPSASVN